ncbi:vitamin K epoxide reductase family protein [Fulvivirgaceae bacterium BMA12]|uniref:Vitamin K epoxide reductase family protein n=1 Tax=Agaribacillus aureus TaxID=3051825 RepID=A0ABT8L7L1_9BACT|nr:vitamin K epoxide reductase family protein [Fulvivirgaceae bacterium BMA12]
MGNEDNAVAVVKKAIKYYEIPVSNNTIAESLKSHPEYPSLKSICDVFDEWRVDNYPMRMDKTELIETGAPFIAHLNEEGEKLAFVPGLNSDPELKYFDSSGKNKVLDEDVFFERYTGIALFIDPDKNAGEEGYVQKKQVDLLHKSILYLAGIALILFIGYSILSFNDRLSITPVNITLFFTRLIGLGLSLLLVLKDLNIDSNLTDKLCGLHKKTNCNSMVNADASKIFGWVHWSDIGLIYFLSGLLTLTSVSNPGDLKLLAILSFGALGFVVFSIYYQAIVVKIWCLLCVLIQFVLLTEAALFYTYLLPIDVTWIAALKYGSLLVTTTFGVVLYKTYFKNKQLSQHEKLAHLRFKRNPKVFSKLLFENKHKIFDLSKEVFVVGNPEAPVEITAFLSLNCAPCQKAFNQLKTVFNNENIKINLIFSLHDHDKSFVNRIAQLYNEKKHREATELLDVWYHSKGNLPNSLIKQAKESEPDDHFEKIQKAHGELFLFAGISETPTIFVQGYNLPEEYRIKDIVYFIDFLKKQKH